MTKRENPMKRTVYIIAGLLLFSLLACEEDNNKDLSMPPARELAFTFIEYAALHENSSPFTNKYFSDEHPAKDFIPGWLDSKKLQLGDGSTALVSYDFKSADRPESLKRLEIPANQLRYEDYRDAWGIPWTEALTPNTNPQTKIPSILAEKYPSAKEGDYKVVEYYYSEKEPTLTKDIAISYLVEGFTGLESEFDYEKLGWLSVSANATRRWISRSWSGVYRAMYTPNGQEPNRKMDAWLISKELDLTAAVNPKFSFDIAAGYYSIHSFSVLISDSFEEGDNPTFGMWADLTDSFNIPRSGPSGYGVMNSAGEISLQKYTGKKVRIAFRFTGYVDPVLGYGTTYELDNIKISETGDLFSVATKNIVRQLFMHNGSTWEMVPQEKIYILQEEDYKSLQVQSIDAAYAEKLLISFLRKKHQTHTEGATLILMYNTDKEQLEADEFTFSNGSWQRTSLPEISVREDKFIYDRTKNQWQLASGE